MSFYKLIKGIRFSQLISLIGFSLKHPLLMFATIKATSKTMKIVEEKFPRVHGLDNKANAFRHALWNSLIAIESLKFEKDIDTVISWTKEITDLHEDFSPNKALARAMDLHNNHMGRALFLRNKSLKERELIKELENLLLNSVQVASIEELKNNKTNLVYIKD